MLRSVKGDRHGVTGIRYYRGELPLILTSSMVRDFYEQQPQDNIVNANGEELGDSPELRAIATQIRQVSQSRQGDAASLLALLRLLEHLHREICEDLFRPALPDTRRALYSFLREIEAHGGWPYIPRMRLKTLLAHLEALETPPTLPGNRSDS